MELENIKEEIQIEEKSLNNFVSYIFHYSQINRPYKRQSTIDKKSEIIDLLIPLMEKSLQLNLNMQKDMKLQIMKLLDAINLRKEILEVFGNDIKESDLKKASNRLGKKSQSTFSEH